MPCNVNFQGVSILEVSFANKNGCHICFAIDPKRRLYIFEEKIYTSESEFRVLYCEATIKPHDFPFRKQDRLEKAVDAQRRLCSH